ncbi:MAG: hypothetical protein RMY29_020960 [Nostoc sp. CreGUA01]|nr:hypothetical protein [Nostoc sp. CreGUA01]
MTKSAVWCSGVDDGRRSPKCDRFLTSGKKIQKTQDLRKNNVISSLRAITYY